MTGKLITLPVRVWFRSTRLFTHVACDAAGRAYSLARPPHAAERRAQPHQPGAEEGAGAAVTAMEPWNGYSQMNAREVIARARQANRAELAAVRRYETRHRRRQTVLAAVDRQLKLASGAAPA
jgi:hypothetical protein